MEECETDMRVLGMSVASKGNARNAGEEVVIVVITGCDCDCDEFMREVDEEEDEGLLRYGELCDSKWGCGYGPPPPPISRSLLDRWDGW
jgi:hypothetical protein